MTRNIGFVKKPGLLPLSYLSTLSEYFQYTIIIYTKDIFIVLTLKIDDAMEKSFNGLVHLLYFYVDLLLRIPSLLSFIKAMVNYL